MIATFFNKSTPLEKLSVIILLSLVVVVDVFSTNAVDLNFIFFAKKIAVLIFLFVNLFLVQFISKKNGLRKENAYDILLVVIFIAMFPLITVNNAILVSHFLLLLAFRRIYSLRTIKNTKEKLFDGSLYIGLAAIVYPWSIFYLFLPYSAIIAFNKRTVRNVIIPLVGAITPIFIYGTYLFLTDNLDSAFIQLDTSFSFGTYNSLQLLIPITLILGFLIWTIFPTTIKIITVNNELKNSWYLILSHLIISIFILIPSPVKNGAEFLFLFFPLAIIFTNYLQLVNEKWFKDVFLYVFLGVAILGYFL